MSTPQSSSTSSSSSLIKGSVPRRDFLKSVAALGGASALAASLPKLRADGAVDAPTGSPVQAAKEAALEKEWDSLPLAAGAKPRESYAPKPMLNSKGLFTLKPREIPFHPVVSKDKYTGRRITRLTPPGQYSNHFYFTSTSYDAEGRILLNAEVDGRRQLVRADMRRGTLHALTDLPEGARGGCVSPAANILIFRSGASLIQMDLETGRCRTLLTKPDGWDFGGPTIDDAGTRIAFSMVEHAPRLPAENVIYSNMPMDFYFRPHSMIITIDLVTGVPSVIWGELAEISHVLIDPVDPNTVVFCHEGGSFADNRLWVVDARPFRKKHAKCLYPEKKTEWLVHEYFCRDGTVGVQITEYENAEHGLYDSPWIYSGMLFVKTDGTVVSNLQLPGWRSGHMQSNSNNSVIVGDSYLPKPDSDWHEGMNFLSLNYPILGNRLRTEMLCYHGSSWRSESAHPHPIFSPDDKQVLYNSEVDNSASAYFVEI